MLPVEVGAGSRGVVLVELAVTLPLIILLLLTATDFGLILRDANALMNLTRSGARSGAVMTAEDPGYWCGAGPQQATSRCDNALAWIPGTTGSLPPQNAAFASAIGVSCRYLSTAGLRPDEWQVTAQGPLVIVEDPAGGINRAVVRRIRVSVARVAAAPPWCFFCVLDSVMDFPATELSDFPMQIIC